jgi:hypothetical protein
MAGKISDFIIQKLMASEQPQQQPQGIPPREAAQAAPASPQSQGQPATMPPPQGGGQGGVDPMVDDIAKKLATLEGSPDQKYQIFVQLVPQIVQAFMMRMQQEQQGGQGGGQYDVTGQNGAMAPQ